MPPPEVRFHFLELRQGAPFSVLASTDDTKVLRGVTRRSQQTKNRQKDTATKYQPVQNCTLATLVALRASDVMNGREVPWRGTQQSTQQELEGEWQLG